MIEVATCPHSFVVIKSGSDFGVLVSECSRCHQVFEYKEGEQKFGAILQVGRIGEAVVLPEPGTALKVTPTESRLVSAGYMQKNGKDESHQPLDIESRSVSKVPVAVVSIEAEPVKPVIIKKERVIMSNEQAKGRYNEEHREEILTDRVAMGHQKAMEKHGIRPAVWSNLKKKWRTQGFDVPDLKRQKDKKVTALTAKSTTVVPKEDGVVDWKQRYDGYRQAVTDIFGTKGE